MSIRVGKFSDKFRKVVASFLIITVGCAGFPITASAQDVPKAAPAASPSAPSAPNPTAGAEAAKRTQGEGLKNQAAKSWTSLITEISGDAITDPYYYLPAIGLTTVTTLLLYAPKIFANRRAVDRAIKVIEQQSDAYAMAKKEQEMLGRTADRQFEAYLRSLENAAASDSKTAETLKALREDQLVRQQFSRLSTTLGMLKGDLREAAKAASQELNQALTFLRASGQSTESFDRLISLLKDAEQGELITSSQIAKEFDRAVSALAPSRELHDVFVDFRTALLGMQKADPNYYALMAEAQAKAIRADAALEDVLLRAPSEMRKEFAKRLGGAQQRRLKQFSYGARRATVGELENAYQTFVKAKDKGEDLTNATRELETVFMQTLKRDDALNILARGEVAPEVIERVQEFWNKGTSTLQEIVDVFDQVKLPADSAHYEAARQFVPLLEKELGLAAGSIKNTLVAPEAVMSKSASVARAFHNPAAYAANVEKARRVGIKMARRGLTHGEAGALRRMWRRTWPVIVLAITVAIPTTIWFRAQQNKERYFVEAENTQDVRKMNVEAEINRGVPYNEQALVLLVQFVWKQIQQKYTKEEFDYELNLNFGNRADERLVRQAFNVANLEWAEERKNPYNEKNELKVEFFQDFWMKFMAVLQAARGLNLTRADQERLKGPNLDGRGGIIQEMAILSQEAFRKAMKEVDEYSGFLKQLTDLSKQGREEILTPLRRLKPEAAQILEARLAEIDKNRKRGKNDDGEDAEQDEEENAAAGQRKAPNVPTPPKAGATPAGTTAPAPAAPAVTPPKPS